MRVELKKFGVVLTSRPAGKEAYLSARAYLLPKNEDEKIELDFSGVAVLSPSWADEFLMPIIEKYGKKVKLKNTDNSSVRATLQILEEIHKFKF